VGKVSHGEVEKGTAENKPGSAMERSRSFQPNITRKDGGEAKAHLAMSEVPSGKDHE